LQKVDLVRRIAEDTVRAHDERSLTGQVAPVPDPQAMVDAMLPEGHRLHVVLEGISRGFSAVNIRLQAHEGSYSPKEPRRFGAINPWRLLALLIDGGVRLRRLSIEWRRDLDRCSCCSRGRN